MKRIPLRIFINTISVNNNCYMYHGDGTGDFERITDSVESKKLLEDYEEYLLGQLIYTKELINNY